jgi:CDP-diglyceride synthetase
VACRHFPVFTFTCYLRHLKICSRNFIDFLQIIFSAHSKLFSVFLAAHVETFLYTSVVVYFIVFWGFQPIYVSFFSRKFFCSVNFFLSCVPNQNLTCFLRFLGKYKLHFIQDYTKKRRI